MLNRDHTWRGQSDASSKDPNSGKSTTHRHEAGKILTRSSIQKLTKSGREATVARQTKGEPLRRKTG